MGTPSAGSVVLVPFPFSDLSRSKLRPAVVLAHVGRGDHVLAQITSKGYADPHAIQILDSSFAKGGLRRESYVRPGKLFTASMSLMVAEIGLLKPEALETIVDSVVSLLRQRTG